MWVNRIMKADSESLKAVTPLYTEDLFAISESTRMKEVTHGYLVLCVDFLCQEINTLRESHSACDPCTSLKI